MAMKLYGTEGYHTDAVPDLQRRRGGDRLLHGGVRRVETMRIEAAQRPNEPHGSRDRSFVHRVADEFDMNALSPTTIGSTPC